MYLLKTFRSSFVVIFLALLFSQCSAPEDVAVPSSSPKAVTAEDLAPDQQVDPLQNGDLIRTINYFRRHYAYRPGMESDNEGIPQQDSNQGFLRFSFGVVDLSTAIRSRQGDSNFYNYTLYMGEEGLRANLFENIHLAQEEDHLLAYIIRYIPENEQLFYYDTNVDCFTGKLEKYDLNRELVAEYYMVNGQFVSGLDASQSDRTRYQLVAEWNGPSCTGETFDVITSVTGISISTVPNGCIHTYTLVEVACSADTEGSAQDTRDGAWNQGTPIDYYDLGFDPTAQNGNTSAGGLNGGSTGKVPDGTEGIENPAERIGILGGRSYHREIMRGPPAMPTDESAWQKLP